MSSNQRYSGRNRVAVTQVIAPYNFVPLSDKVVEPNWAGEVKQDVPFSDGVRGTVKLRLVPHGPLFVRGGEAEEGGKKVQRFFTIPIGRTSFAIPGTTIRGMLRNVLH
ncbi:MAG: hypothetical protein HN348_35440, partial [Proteobacteria bacterium]|nr:hypothetical protein [Pseudomonadota bacterium]